MKGEGDIFLERVKWDLLIAKYLKFLRARVWPPAITSGQTNLAQAGFRFLIYLLTYFIRDIFFVFVQPCVCVCPAVVVYVWPYMFICPTVVDNVWLFMFICPTVVNYVSPYMFICPIVAVYVRPLLFMSDRTCLYVRPLLFMSDRTCLYVRPLLFFFDCVCVFCPTVAVYVRHWVCSIVGNSYVRLFMFSLRF